jgi:hypothetical protein
MSANDATTHSAPISDTQAVTRPASRQWLIGAFLLAGAAQLITISALTSADPAPATWAALLLAIAPAPLTAAAAFAHAPVARLAMIVAAAVLVAGIIGTVEQTGLFFAPALVLLVVGGLKSWQERA